jgi:hypothetical protein
MSTYTPIASQTLTGNATSITFSNIPQGYTDLVIVTNVKSTSTGNLVMRYNSDASASYSLTRLTGDSSSAQSGRLANYNEIYTDSNGYYDGSNFNQAKIINLMNYSNTATFKNCLIRSNRAQTGTDAIIGLWRSTSAITSVLLSGNGNTLVAGSTFNLYGIAAGSAKAKGGLVTTDGTYWYHTFKGSGFFSTYQSLTVDYLVIAGGAGGSAGQTNNSIGAGGGAGGLRSTVGATGGGGSLGSALSLSADTNYEITVGAGGPATLYPNYGGTSGSNSVFSTITSIGGGGGGGNVGPGAPNGNGVSGGSGGGGRMGSTTGGSGTANQGYAGGAGGNVSGGGGGGTGGTGGNGSGTQGGNGGAGVSISAWATPTSTGVSNYYAGGGGGSSDTSASQPSGGSGGGGAGSAKNAGNATAGTLATGSGGGGGTAGDTANQWGGNGGSGLVIVRYAV